MKLRSLIYTATLLLTLTFATSALAGPPLLCHAFDIGDAKSLPWISHNWNLSGTESYDTKNLSADTLAILNTDSTVIVHMETLRRAALYAQKDSGAARQLLLKLTARANSADGSSAAIADFDAGYFAATLDQLHWINKEFANPAQGFDAYALVKKALRARPNDAQMNFAAALVTFDGPISDQREYAQRAIAGAGSNPLLARNLATHFIGPQTETMADMISRNSTTKVARQ
ncbi:MAG TPA: hypothetical protein VMH31_07420 [Methylomirabilota bacterium]|nr:hypothetical protein [Methylomirabilota bacterium]